MRMVNKNLGIFSKYILICAPFSDPEKLSEVIQEQEVLTDNVSYDLMSEEERTKLLETTEAFAKVNKKATLTAKEIETWTKYFHNIAVEKFNQNCLKELLREHKSDTVL